MSTFNSIVGIKKSNTNYFVVVGKDGCGFTSNAVLALENTGKTFYYLEYHDLTPAEARIVNRECKDHRTFPRVFYGKRLIGGYTELKSFLNY